MDDWNLYEDTIGKHKENIFIVDTDGNRITYGELNKRVEILTPMIQYMLPGGSVAWMGNNNPDFYVVVLACLKAERPLFIFYGDWRADQVAGNMSSHKIPNLLYDEEIDIGSLLLQSDMSGLSIFSFAGLKSNKYDIRTIKKPTIAKDYADYKCALYLATSGTTTQNKWVCHSLKSIFTSMRALAKKLELKETDRIHSILPIFTSNGMTITFFLPFSIGASIFLDKRFSPFNIGGYFKNGVNAGVTILSLVPSIINILNKITSKDTKELIRGKEIRFCICGTAPLKQEDIIRFESLSGVPIYVNYGLTETLFISSQNHDFHTKGSSGSVLDDVVLSFHDGQICVGGDSLMKGYVGEQPLNEAFHTGDLGILKGGELYISGRNKDIVIRGGYKINPIEVDNLLSRLDSVVDCYSFGVPDDISGEEFYSAVVLKTGNKREMLIELKKYIQEVLPQYMIPKILVVSSMPRNATGKPLKRELIKLAGNWKEI